MHALKSMITIYDKDGNTKNVPLTKEAVHEQELMKSNFIRLSWNDRSLYTIPVGSYIMHEGVKYMLLDPYTPKQNRHKSFTYTPEFQHPIMWLGRIPFYTTVNDPTTEEDVKKYDWTYANYPRTIIDYLKEFVNEKVALSDIGTNWQIEVDPNLPTTGVVSFNSLDVLSAAAAIANAFDCQYNFDFQSKYIRFGNFKDGGFALSSAEPVVLKSGENIGVASVSESKEDYHNAYFVQGSTRNLSKLTDNGEFVQVVNRLTLNPSDFSQGGNPDSMIYVDENGREIPSLPSGVPLCAKSLIFDDVYPKYNLYLYNIRERRCWLLDENGNKIGASESDGWKDTDNHWYKYYSKWYCRLAYYTNQQTGKPLNTETYGDKTYYWYDYELKDNVKAKVSSKSQSDNKNRIFTELPYIMGSLTDNRVTITCNNVTDTAAIMDFTQDAHAVFYVSNALYNAVSEGDTILITGGLDSTKFDEKYRDSLIIKDKVLSLVFQPNYFNYDDSNKAESTPLTSREFTLVYFNQDRNEKEDDDIEAGGFNALKGDFRIDWNEDNGLRLPTTYKGGMYPKPKKSSGQIIPEGGKDYKEEANNGYPSIKNNIATLVNIVVDNTSLAQAQSELKVEALKQIAYYFQDLNKYSFPTDPVEYRKNPLSLFIGQRATYNDGQGANKGEDYELSTQIIKLVTRLDKPEITNISVGNEKAKGVISTMKEQIETIISGGFGTSEGSGGGITENQFLQLLITHGDKRYIRRDVNDETNTNLTANKFIAKEGVKTDTIIPKTENGAVTVNAPLTSNGAFTAETVAEIKGLLTALQGVVTDMIVNSASKDKQPADLESLLGEGFLYKIDDYGKSHVFLDYLTVRLKAYFAELEIRRLSYVGGSIVLTPAGSKLEHVIEVKDGQNVVGYKCFIMADDGTTATQNSWAVGDQARCQIFNIQEGIHQNVSNKYYWRLVTDVGQEKVNKNYEPDANGTLVSYIVLSNVEDETIGGVSGYKGYDDSKENDAPEAGDTLVGMGNQLPDSGRGNIIILRTVSEDTNNVGAPSITMYKNVGQVSDTHTTPYSLTGREVVDLSPENFIVQSEFFQLKTSANKDTYPVTLYRDNYSPLSTYNIGHTVTYDGQLWECKVNGTKGTTPSESSSVWKLVAKGKATKIYSVECSSRLVSTASLTNQVPVVLGGQMQSSLYAVALGDYMLQMSEEEAGSTAVIDVQTYLTNQDGKQRFSGGRLLAQNMSGNTPISEIKESSTGSMTILFSEIDPNADHVQIIQYVNGNNEATTSIGIVKDGMDGEFTTIEDVGSYANITFVDTPTYDSETGERNGTTSVIQLHVHVAAKLAHVEGDETSYLTDLTGYYLTAVATHKASATGAVTAYSKNCIVSNGAFTLDDTNFIIKNGASPITADNIGYVSKNVTLTLTKDLQTLAILEIPVVTDTDSVYTRTKELMQSMYMKDGYVSQIKQTANTVSAHVAKLGDQFLPTGWDVEYLKMRFRANSISFENNSGVKTAWLDEFGNWITTGVQNNLITKITSENASNYILCDNDNKLFLDVLRCGDFIHIQSLPNNMIGGDGSPIFIRLPYYIEGGAAQRGVTKFINGEQHPMFSDEMRQLVGRRITIRNSATATYTFLNGIANFNYYGTEQDAIRRISNGQHVFNYNDVEWSRQDGDTGSIIGQDYSLVPRVFHIECKHAVLVEKVGSTEYTHSAYIWTGQSDYFTDTDDGLDWGEAQYDNL